MKSECYGETMKRINEEFYVKRNEESARERYGDLLDENRRVKGTDIWFDWRWRIHVGESKHES